MPPQKMPLNLCILTELCIIGRSARFANWYSINVCNPPGVARWGSVVMKEVEGGVWRLAWLPAPATISAGLRARPGGGGVERERRPSQAQGTRGRRPRSSLPDLAAAAAAASMMATPPGDSHVTPATLWHHPHRPMKRRRPAANGD